LNPILAKRGRLGPYLAAWIPLTGIILELLAVAGKLSWVEATVLAIPLGIVHAFICLSPWYLCAVLPPERSRLGALLVGHVTAALVCSLLWFLIGLQISHALAVIPVFSELPANLGGQFPILFPVGVILYLLAVAFHYVLIAFEKSQKAETKEIESRLLAREAELRALKQQLNPHFLFNSLNSVSALSSSDPGKAREMCELLSDFLRQSLGLGERTSIALEEELSLASTFLAIERVRFGPRIELIERIDSESLGIAVPPLILQPLVENAVTHGIATLLDGGAIEIESRRRGARLEISVANRFDSESPRRRGTGLGLLNVKRRLAARYGAEATLNESERNGVFRVELSIPLAGA